MCPTFLLSVEFLERAKAGYLVAGADVMSLWEVANVEAAVEADGAHFPLSHLHDEGDSFRRRPSWRCFPFLDKIF